MNETNWFFDTSILLYLLSADDRKADTAEVLLQRSGNISVQVLNEFSAVGREKLGLSFGQVAEFTGAIRTVCRVHPLTEEIYDRGMEIAVACGFSVYDSMIVGSALVAGCETLYSEDLQDRQVIDGTLTVVNPFNTPAPAA